MITFIVIGNFVLNASLLDNQRLAKQRVEACQIIDALQNGGRWKNHPAVLAWKQFITALKYYTNCIILEWIRRGGNNNLPLFEIPDIVLLPWWSQWDRLHQSHRAMLMRKNPFYYQDQFEVNPEYMNYGYIWPHLISYEERDLPLSQITNDIPKELINPVYCQSLIKSGSRKGSPCHVLIKDKSQFCTIHRKNQHL